jgi:hypothetical protein
MRLIDDRRLRSAPASVLVLVKQVTCIMRLIDDRRLCSAPASVLVLVKQVTCIMRLIDDCAALLRQYLY